MTYAKLKVVGICLAALELELSKLEHALHEAEATIALLDAQAELVSLQGE